MTSTYSVRIAAFTIAVAMTALVHGTMLWSFDSVAQQATQQSAITAKTQAATAQQS
jgi:hypothetical protein